MIARFSAKDRMPGPVAYLTEDYPAASHTFILREIAALRRLGVRVLPCSVCRLPAYHLIGEEERAAARKTFYLLEGERQQALDTWHTFLYR